jgi:hypothetical protein
VLGEVVRFLELPPYPWQTGNLQEFHVGRYEQPLAGATRGLLREFYQPHNDELYAFLGHDFGW